MKRAGRLFDAIVDYENLRVAVYRALKGKRYGAEPRAWTANLDANLRRIARQLGNGTFPVGRFHQFTIHDPKERLITAPSFEERVVHHAIVNVVEPHLDCWLIEDTFACRKGKGRVKCLLRAQCFARTNPWFLRLDVRKYFDSVSHDRLLALWRRRFKDERLFALISRITRCYRTEMGKGLPIGCLTSQHFANFYLGWLDRFIKEELRIRGYVRYMDDMAIWSADFQTARRTELAVRAFLAKELGLELKPEPYANRTAHGMDFLGCRLFPAHMIPNRRSRIRFRRKWRALSEAFDEYGIGEREFQDRATSLFSYLTTKGLSSWRFRRRVLSSPEVSGREARSG